MPFSTFTPAYRCGDCSIQKEYEAYHVDIYALEEMGRMDLVEACYPGLTNSNGGIDQDRLWEVLKETYSECPEY